MQKKFLSILMTLCMVLTLATPGFAAFEDSQSHWAASSIERWNSSKVFNGDENGNFYPDQEMYRAEFAQMLANMMGYTEKAENTFADMSDDAWYADAILKLAAAGVMQGDGVNSLATGKLTREQSAVLLCRALDVDVSDTSGLEFGDSDSVSPWAQGAVAALARRGMVNGVGGNTYAPIMSINRASVAKMMDNMISTYAHEDGTVITGEQKGFVVVVAKDVTVENAALAENLIMAPGAAEGKLNVTGGSTLANVIVKAPGSAVSLDESAAAQQVTVTAADTSTEIAGTVGAITVAENAAGTTVTVAENAVVEQITITAADAVTEISGTVATVTVAEGASGAAITVAEGAVVGTLETAADNVSVAGSGTVESMVVNGGEEITVSKDLTVDTTENNSDTTITETEIETDTGDDSSSSTGGGSTGGDTGGGGSGSGDSGSGDSGSGDSGSGGTGGGSETTTYTVTFNSNEGSAVDAQSVSANGTATKPADPTRDGYTFGGWFTDADFTTEYDFTAAVTGDITLYAKWNEVTPTTYTVTFNSNEGSAVDAQTVNANGTATKPADPTRDGYTFGGWFTDAACQTEYDFTAAVTSNITLYAKWTAVEGPDTGDDATYTITVDTSITNGTVTANPTSAKAGDTVTLTVTATNGYEVGNVSVKHGDESVTATKGENNTYTFTMPSGNVTVSATFQETTTGGGEGEGGDTPTTETYTAAVYVVNKDAFTYNADVYSTADDTTAFTVSDGGSVYTVTSDSSIVLVCDSTSVPTPTKSGYTFDGWYSEEACTTKVESVEAGKPYYVKFTKNTSST